MEIGSKKVVAAEVARATSHILQCLKSSPMLYVLNFVGSAPTSALVTARTTLLAVQLVSVWIWESETYVFTQVLSAKTASASPVRSFTIFLTASARAFPANSPRGDAGRLKVRESLFPFGVKACCAIRLYASRHCLTVMPRRPSMIAMIL